MTRAVQRCNCGGAACKSAKVDTVEYRVLSMEYRGRRRAAEGRGTIHRALLMRRARRSHAPTWVRPAANLFRQGRPSLVGSGRHALPTLPETGVEHMIVEIVRERRISCDKCPRGLGGGGEAKGAYETHHPLAALPVLPD